MIERCRSCDSAMLVEVLDLGMQYLSHFYERTTRPPRFPLRLVVCESCTLAQLDSTAPPSELYTDTYSFKSGISEGIRNNLEQVVKHALAYVPEPKSWLDIASNDGTLLSYVPKDVHRIGVDPLRQFADEAAKHAGGIYVEFFKPELFSVDDPFDVITSVSMFYDVPDPNAFVADVKSILAPGGVWVIQQNYLPTMIRNASVDNISHEHLTYWSITSLSRLLERHGLVIEQVSFDPINGGCFRTVVRHADGATAVQWMNDAPTLDDYNAFSDKSLALFASIRQAVNGIKAKGQRVWIYGASTRGAVLWQGAGLTVEDVPFAVERNWDKVGKYFSAVGSKIVSEDYMRESAPDYLLIGPYWLKDLIIERESAYLEGGGRLIFPVPNMEVVAK